MPVSDFPVGTAVTGRVPSTNARYNAMVVRHDGKYAVTKDDSTGQERKALPGLLTKR